MLISVFQLGYHEIQGTKVAYLLQKRPVRDVAHHLLQCLEGIGIFDTWRIRNSPVLYSISIGSGFSSMTQKSTNI